MIAAGLIFAGVAIALHVYIWVLESFLWTSDATTRKFGMTKTQAEQTRQLAFNQGYYNLFLAITAAAGVYVFQSGQTGVGLALITAGLGSMVAAGLVLALNDRRKVRPALIQLTAPLMALALLYTGS